MSNFKIMKFCQNHLYQLILSPQPPPDDTLTITPPSPTDKKRRLPRTRSSSLLSKRPRLADVEKPATPPPLPDRGKRVRVRTDNSPVDSMVPLPKRTRLQCIKPPQKKPAAPSAHVQRRPAVVSSDEEDIADDDEEVDAEEAPIRLRKKPYVPRKNRAVHSLATALNSNNYNLFSPQKEPVR
jgi:hypothetical protein